METGDQLMKVLKFQGKTLRGASYGPLLALFATCSGYAGAPIYLSPGASIQAAVNTFPAGSTFVLREGTYRLQTIAPKDGDSFSGQGKAVLNGSQVLNFRPTPNLPRFWVADSSTKAEVHGYCQRANPLCAYAQDLFIDNVLKRPVSSISEVTSDSWYFDRTNGKIYLSVDPTNRVVELSALADAFHGNAKNVQISNLIVEKYASPAQHGAVGGNRTGSDWVVNKVEVRWNHGAGIEVGPGSRIINSYIHHNGQLGVATGGVGSEVIGNEISWNNYAGFDTAWEAGGSKFWATTNLLVRSNSVHDNNGNGLWTDNDNVGTIYENNRVISNRGGGIVHEISGRAIIRNNTVEENGCGTPSTWLWNSQIQIQNSSNVEVYGNFVEVSACGGNGIAIINQNRGVGTFGPHVAANDYVHNNTITYLGKHGASGYVDDTDATPQPNDRFDYNHYITSAGGSHWNWVHSKDWNGLRASGQETHGSCCK